MLFICIFTLLTLKNESVLKDAFPKLLQKPL